MVSGATMPLSVRFPEDLKRKLSFLSKISKKSQSALVAEAVENYLENYVDFQERQIEGVKQAIIESENGKWVDGDKAMEWMFALGTEDEIPRPKSNA